MKCSAVIQNACGGTCERDATMERDGAWYCWQHDPERIKAKRKAEWEARKKEIARIEAEQDARIERRKLEKQSGVGGLTNDDLRLIIALGGIGAILARHEESHGDGP